MFHLSRVTKLVAKASDTAAELTGFNKEICPSCGKELTVGQYTKLSYGRSYVTCVCCNQKYCKDCINMSLCPIPKKLWHPHVPKTDDMMGYVCINHGPKALVLHIISLSKDWSHESMTRLVQFVQNGNAEEFPKPTSYTRSGVAYRLTILATTVASYAGYDNYVKLIRYAMMGKAVLALLLDNNVMGLLAPLMPLLKEFDITSPNDMLTMYYLGCNSELQRKLHEDGEHRGHFPGDEGVVACLEETDINQKTGDDALLEEYLQLISQYAAPAQWLYSSVLPRPHDDIAWSTWYFSRVVAHDGWTVLASQCKSQKLPDDTPVPAFALVARQLSSCDVTTDGKESIEVGGQVKEAVLVIRGSKSPTDWRINVSRKTTRFAYRSGPMGASTVVDQVHTGMLVAARAILDVFGMRASVHKLLKAGYDVKVVGHSLGAGVATLIVAELKNGLFVRLRRLPMWLEMEDVEEDDEGRHSEDTVTERKYLMLGMDYPNTWVEYHSARDESESLEGGSMGTLNVIPRVQAVGFGPPPCVGEKLSGALGADGLVVCMIHRDDIVPRLSPQNVKLLALEVKEFGPQAKVWMRDDQARLERYARTVGKEGVMGGSPHDTIDADGETMGHVDVCDEAKQDTANESAEKDCSMDAKDDKNHWVPMVVPGCIVHLTKKDGAYRATLCTHRLSCLRRIDMYRNTVDDHHMSSHIRSIRMLKMTSSSNSSVAATNKPPIWQPVRDPITNKWACCSVCHSDPTWPYITNGDASRALVYHHCRACGKVVCVMCAPAGDSVPDVGLGKFQQLKDFRIPIPSLGLLMPERVCLPCYLHCHQK